MQQLMKSMREATMSSGMLDNSGTQLGTEMLDAQFASKMSGLPGGLADAIARQLERQMGGGRGGRSRRRRRQARRHRRRGRGAVAEADRLRRRAPGRGEERRGDERHPGGLHDRPGGARVGLGQARDQERRRLVGAQPVRHQGRRPAGPGRSTEVTTTEYVNGAAQKVSAKFRAYASDEESFRDYAKLMKESPRYAGVVAQAAQAPASAASAQGFAQGLQRAGYATDPAYADKLARVINTTLRLQRTT